jgi:uncharacterized membrane protein YgcG
LNILIVQNFCPGENPVPNFVFQYFFESMKTKKILIQILLSVFLIFPFAVLARENVNYWYIKDFQAEITLNKDSSANIIENITADCGNALDKHGIFRILPTQINLTNGQKIETPVKLINITDFNGQPIKYTESQDIFNHTVTWKIGDPNITVQGVNYYRIEYRVGNVIRFGNPDFDEFYWNLNGNFWDLETDNFSARIIFPPEVSQTNSKVDYYTGLLGSKDKNLASYNWASDNVLEFHSTQTLLEKQGITASVVFPKNIFIPYRVSLAEEYWWFFDIRLLIPILVFIVCFIIWWKFGKDPKAPEAIVPEYDAPKNLSPIELGMLHTDGRLKNEFITAEIINLAVKGIITIAEVENDFLFFHRKDYQLARTENIGLENSLNPAQKIIFGNIFKYGNRVMLSQLKKERFFSCLKDVEKAVEGILEENNLMAKESLWLRNTFHSVGAVLLLLAIFVFGRIFNDFFWILIFIASGIIILIFGFFMPRRTIEGAQINWEIDGFKLYMKTAEKYRSQFYEKENIFEKLLPYAIVFGITELWIKKMQEIYGQDFYAHYAPIWFVGNFGAFDANSLNAAIGSLSSSIAANTSAPSGAGGAGGAGGGGGGGGGGGW